MNNAEFTKLLDEQGYSYTVKDGAVVVTHDGDVVLDAATSIPNGKEQYENACDLISSMEELPFAHFMVSTTPIFERYNEDLKNASDKLDAEELELKSKDKPSIIEVFQPILNFKQALSDAQSRYKKDIGPHERKWKAQQKAIHEDVDKKYPNWFDGFDVNEMISE